MFLIIVTFYIIRCNIPGPACSVATNKDPQQIESADANAVIIVLNAFFMINPPSLCFIMTCNIPIVSCTLPKIRHCHRILLLPFLFQPCPQ